MVVPITRGQLAPALARAARRKLASMGYTATRRGFVLLDQAAEAENANGHELFEEDREQMERDAERLAAAF